MKPLLIILTAAGIVAAGCAPPPDTGVEDALVELAEATEAYHQALDNRDLEAFAGFYAAEARMFPPNHASVMGQAAIRAYAEEQFAIDGLSISSTFAPPRVGAGADLGFTTGITEVSMPGPEGMITDRGPDVHVWQKQADGSWKILIDIWNSEKPLPEPDEGGH